MVIFVHRGKYSLGFLPKKCLVGQVQALDICLCTIAERSILVTEEVSPKMVLGFFDSLKLVVMGRAL